MAVLAMTVAEPVLAQTGRNRRSTRSKTTAAARAHRARTVKSTKITPPAYLGPMPEDGVDKAREAAIEALADAANALNPKMPAVRPNMVPQKQGLKSHVREIRDGYNYWLYTPEVTYEKIEPVAVEPPDPFSHDSVEVVREYIKEKPVILFLHGASLCGTDLNKVRRYGTIDAIEKGRDIDAYVIAPQNPGGAWQPQKLMNILQHVIDTCPIDTTRIYVVGMSLGGYGTIDMVAKYPDKIAAAMAFCGGGNGTDYDVLNQVPLWIVHGTADRAVSISQSDKVVSSMKGKTGRTPRLIYNRVPGMNHGAPARLFYLQESYDWLLSHSLTDDNREVATNSIIGSNALKNAYQGLKSHNPNLPRKSKAKTKTRKRRRR